ncbi:hypothetical protein P389DRAFT_176962 [Cystobasidium minutum MCA 4210]|uniref:uncharacterized protein n=1 Tax=Cystobasidium minutum MCA 4210 TaxID=1397322 RepID=UPI0034CF3F96|eukprot:jgi/Rhomi1/176962/fgenesh1_pg.1_\
MSSGDAQPALLNAFLLTTKDALMVFEAARRGICPVVTRRLHDGEKSKMITSGSVFAFDEQSTGIKRWTDGALWSPSRIIGNYLIYRELDKKGEKDGGRPSTQSGPAATVASPHGQQSDPFDTAKDSLGASTSEGTDGRPSTSIVTGSTGLHRELERALVGSLTTSYRFKKDGLIKKTISNGHLHLILLCSTIDDVLAGRLRTPSSLIELASLEISSTLLDPKNFRMPPVTEKGGHRLTSDWSAAYIGEETDPIGAPPILAPLLAPGAVPATRPMSAIADPSYGLAQSGGPAAFEAADSQLFAYKPADDRVYQGPLGTEHTDAPYTSQGPHQQYHSRRPDTAQPLWSSQQFPEGPPPMAGPSNWHEREIAPYPQADVPPPPQPLHGHSHLPHHQIPSQPFDSQYRSALHRSHSGTPQDIDQPPLIDPHRPLTQFRRQSYRPPTSSYPCPSRSTDPYARPMAIRPATSPAPSPVVYGSAPSFSSIRGSLSMKPEPHSPALQHVSQPSTSAPYSNLPPNPDFYQYSNPQSLPGPSYSLTSPYPAHQQYATPSPTAHSAPPRTGPAFYYNGAPPQFYDQEPPPAMLPQYPDQLQEPQTAPAYASDFQQRPSFAGPVRQQRFGPKLEDPS